MVDESTRMRVIRAILGWDMKKMSKVLGVHPHTISNWEYGRSVPLGSSRKTISEICQKYHIAIRSDGMPVVE